MPSEPEAFDRERLGELTVRERAAFATAHPTSRRSFERARQALVAGVPMSWMAKWPGGFPLAVARARGARIVDVDGRELIDFCLGDTGAMAGHSPLPVLDAVERRLRELGGATLMLPTEDGAAVGEELARRFGLPLWQFTLSATDANRFVLRFARQITRRPLVLVFNGCYHGTVDESLVTLLGGLARSRSGNVGPAVDPTTTTRVVEFNDLPAVERALADRRVACVLAEPALTNIGIVLPEPGFLTALRQLTRDTGTLLVLDETHTLSAGAGGCTAAWGLDPDVVTLGKAIGGGLPIGAYGLSVEVAERLAAEKEADLVDTGGVGGTLAGNALSLAATRATLEEVLTPEAFKRMTALGARFAAGVQATIARRNLPWSVVQIGARAEYRFVSPAPHDGGASAVAADPALDEYFHLRLLNRGVLMTPFHNMALCCPATSEADVDRHAALFADAVDDLLA